MPKHSAVVLKKNIEKFAKCRKRGLGGYHSAIGVSKVGACAALNLHYFFEDRRPRVTCDSRILLVGQRGEMDIINTRGNDVLFVRKLCGSAEVDDGTKSLFIAQFLCNLGLDFAQMSASVKLAVANALAVCRRNAAKVAEIFDFTCHFVLLKNTLIYIIS